jgi:hypothetical protein
MAHPVIAMSSTVCLLLKLLAWLQNSKEFFIVTADHDEWGHAHSVWAQVSSMAAADVAANCIAGAVSICCRRAGLH